ncbi:hypothetical protein SEA_CIRCINUS_247 [Streptomyces phage Circinus]|uniref:Uncharacterized protein n=1 Tax=Streptomyces phage Circinus TaxID=2562189 RepID=A0A4D6E1H8_9CAUD|nr:hypothetical protein SEA_CIRCINUS_2 [Streptomyces phage Circinus]QBZ72500.1 hypothetical protein SEA_CIRCINUS_247 [Streptomyces phage Circinus]
MRKQMGWVALWFGGSSYAHSYMSDHAEYFHTLKAARLEFIKRYLGWADIRRIEFDEYDVATRIAGSVESTRTPAVDETSYMDLFPLWTDGTYGELSRRIEFGPRQGIHVTKA